jgi:hypothetical protein
VSFEFYVYFVFFLEKNVCLYKQLWWYIMKSDGIQYTCFPSIMDYIISSSYNSTILTCCNPWNSFFYEMIFSKIKKSHIIFINNEILIFLMEWYFPKYKIIPWFVEMVVNLFRGVHSLTWFCFDFWTKNPFEPKIDLLTIRFNFELLIKKIRYDSIQCDLIWIDFWIFNLQIIIVIKYLKIQ